MGAAARAHNTATLSGRYKNIGIFLIIGLKFSSRANGNLYQKKGAFRERGRIKPLRNKNNYATVLRPNSSFKQVLVAMNVLKVSYTSPDAPELFTRSIRETGFAVLADHPIAADLIFEAYQDWVQFFASEEKHRYTFKQEEQWGYFPYLSENAKDQDVKDLKEFYHLYVGTPMPERMSDRTLQLFDQLSALAGQLLTWIEDNSPEDVRAGFSQPLKAMIQDSKRTLLRILHYPPITDSVTPGSVRAAAHEDINLITLLPAATAPGLQVLDTKGNWHDVACDPANIVINSGDMLKEASGGYYGSTTHQVINPREGEPNEPRYSMPLFLHPRPEVRLSERRTADEYLTERLIEIGLISKT